MGGRSWQRARSDDQVEVRIRSLLDAAAALFRRGPYAEVTLQAIAREAGFTRSNVYRYFTTKEEIFLALYMGDIDAWLADLDSTMPGPLSREEFTERWLEVTFRQERLLALSHLLAPTLEANVSAEAYRDTKRRFAEVLVRVGVIVARAQPGLDPEDIQRLLTVHQALVAGAWPMCRRTDEQQRILEDMGLSDMWPDFETTIRDAVDAYLRGVMVRKGRIGE